MRVVIDTNVLVSATLFKAGTPRKTLSYVMRFCTPVCSEEMLREYRRVMTNTDFDRYAAKAKRITLLDTFENGSEIVPISGVLKMCRDPHDNAIVETALAGEADVLITGDEDILSLRPLDAIDIVTPAEFVKKYIH